MSLTVDLNKKVEVHSQQISQELRDFFTREGIFVVNLIGSPGAGKTSLLECLAPRFRHCCAVIEGDLQTDKDKVRIEKAGLPAYEINTLGACHLDGKMIQRALAEFSLEGRNLLFIENVGNLVCPAGFQIGEDIKVAVISVTEGDDKPAKYPTALRVASALVITKTDLGPYVNCDVEAMERDALAIHPELKIFKTSIREPGSFLPFAEWIESQAVRRRA